MQRVTALVRRPVIDTADLDFLAAAKPVAAGTDWLAGDLDSAVARLETAMIQRALAAAGGNRTEAARRLGIHRQLLHTKLRRYGLEAS
jgi:two-component system NtrC family response regulator